MNWEKLIVNGKSPKKLILKFIKNSYNSVAKTKLI